ncbi:MAG: aldo/keto reductase [Cytophagia bacterium]|nr:MAG: aldo/keto reductase [Runella sp.]TAG20558.1 MAG: aldo/keto reductase [Cytophagales bacterium]TAG39766.1 MAG: aldo/keto reductase [Cytophagia bacterium]TAG52742.1 MAG: aldo/keto reductase [Runella slithyformis]TAG81358.1 MAG: aldo/keto reductase [Cytophagales bacterium]
MPFLGLGVYEPNRDQNLVEAIEWAFEIGYRLIDTAAAYRNETEVGLAMKNSGLARHDLFLTTKVWNDDMGYESTLRAFDTSLQKLNTDYVDLYLIHWPVRDKRRDTWRALEYIYEQGGAKAIGVCNYYQPHLEELFTYANVKPAVNQFEFHPYCFLPQELAFCRQHQIQVQGYAPVVRGWKNDDLRLETIAQKYGKSTYQILIRWSLQHQVVTIPKSVTQHRLRENFEVFDFQINAEDMALMNTFFDDTRVAWHPMEFL